MWGSHEVAHVTLMKCARCKEHRHFQEREFAFLSMCPWAGRSTVLRGWEEVGPSVRIRGRRDIERSWMRGRARAWAFHMPFHRILIASVHRWRNWGPQDCITCPCSENWWEDEDWYKSFSDPKTGDLSVLWDRWKSSQIKPEVEAPTVSPLYS